LEPTPTGEGADEPGSPAPDAAPAPEDAAPETHADGSDPVDADSGTIELADMELLEEDVEELDDLDIDFES